MFKLQGKMLQARQRARKSRKQRSKSGGFATSLQTLSRPNLQMNPMTVLSRTIPALPQRFKATLRYYDWGQAISVVAGTCNSRFFSANGLFDPDVSGTGHQPMPFDQLMAWYEQACVVSSSITVTAVPETSPLRVGVYLSPDTTNITDPVRLMENGLIETVALDAASTGGGTGQRVGQISYHCNVVDYFHRESEQALLDDPDMYNTVAANPVEQVYFGIPAWVYSSQSATGIVDYDVVICYEVWFTEPRKLAIS